MSRFVAPDGLKLHYLDEGEGLPLVCLPGLTRNAFDFDELAEAVRGRCRVIRLTLRGREPSDFDPDHSNYVVPVEARDVVALMDHLGLSRAVVVGTSRGGLIAMVLAAFAKERLAGVLLNDIGPELVPEGLERIMSYVGMAPRVDSFEALAASVAAMMGPQFPDLSGADWVRLTRRWFSEADGRPALAYDPRIRDAMLEAPPAEPGAMWPLFDALEGVPLALVRGANTDLVSEATVAAMRARRPDMIYAEIPGRGHVPFLNEPEALAALEALLSRVEA
jgi:pimeloyl-ACP methyl ester carboxylesterase